MKKLNPHEVTALTDFRILGTIFDGLVKFNKLEFTKLEPALATSWSVSSDGRRYRFELRHDVKFHDSTIFNSLSVVANFKRMFEYKETNKHVGVFASEYFGRIFDSDTNQVHVYDVGEYTVEFVLDSPYSPFLSNLATPAGFIISPATLHRENGFDMPAGTGPYMVMPGWCKTCSLKLQRFDRAWSGYGKTEFVTYDSTPSFASTLSGLSTKEVNVVVEPSTELKRTAANHGDIKLVSQIGSANHNFYFILNMKVWPTSDINFRQALNYAINKTNLGIKFGATISEGCFASGFLPNTGSQDAYNPELARKLIDYVGASEKTLTLNVPIGDGSGMFDQRLYVSQIREDLRRAGIFLKVETYEFNDYLTRINAGLGADIDMAAMGWTLHNAIVLARLVLHSSSFPSKNGFNSGYYSSAQVDFLIDKGKNATSLEDAQSNLEELHYTVRRDYPWLFLLNDHPVYVVNRGVHQVHLASPFTLDIQNGYFT